MICRLQVGKLAGPSSPGSPHSLWFPPDQPRGRYKGSEANTGGGRTVCVQGGHGEGQCGLQVWPR